MLLDVLLVALFWRDPLVKSLWAWGYEVHREIRNLAATPPPALFGARGRHSNCLVVLLIDAGQRRRFDRAKPVFP